MTLPTTQLGSNTQPKIIFSLLSENGDIVCDNPPKEFKNISIELNRDMEWGGVFVEFKVSDLTFTGSTERRLLRDLWDQRRKI